MYQIEPLGKHHDRADFSCGVEALDTYLHKQADQDARRMVAAPFVLVAQGNSAVLGYCTLSQMGINLGTLPEDVAKKLPGYPVIPATLLGRLAVDDRHRGQRLGEYLLIDALQRSWELSHEIASAALVVDAKDEQARAFYVHYEFRPLLDQRQRLFLTMKLIDKLFA